MPGGETLGLTVMKFVSPIPGRGDAKHSVVLILIIRIRIKIIVMMMIIILIMMFIKQRKLLIL